MNNIAFLDADFIESNTDFKDLIARLKSGFSEKKTHVPMRHHHDFPNPSEGKDSTLLLMPAWNPNADAGVKIVTISPENGKYDLPSIQGTYIYLDSKTGVIKGLLEAKALTVKRTAAASALASRFLSRKDASSLLMIGTGALSVNLIEAHAAVRPIKNVYVWGRNFKKAQAICDQLCGKPFDCIAIKTISEMISKVDIISCATLSESPLVFGKHLVPGQHVDLVGAYKPNMREADDATVLKSDVYVDTFDGGLKESGDIVIPLKTGVLKELEIKADLFDLCGNKKPGRTSEKTITMFKSVGHALEDLVAANYYFNLKRDV
jgi:ornithine cyclodeaminase